jgi:hypothetical protein
VIGAKPDKAALDVTDGMRSFETTGSGKNALPPVADAEPRTPVDALMVAVKFQSEASTTPA